MSSSASAPLLLERRAQYYEYLLDAMRSNIHRRVREWFDAIYADKKRRPQALKHLQDVLAKVAGWNAMRVAAETAAVVSNEDAEYLPKLLTALLTVEIKLLVVDEAAGSFDAKDVTVRVPALEAFVHQCFVESARQLWKNIALFDPTLSKLEQQKNFVTCDAIVSKAIRDAVRKSLPIKDIIRNLPSSTPTSTSTSTSITTTPLLEQSSDIPQQAEPNTPQSPPIGDQIKDQSALRSSNELQEQQQQQQQQGAPVEFDTETDGESESASESAFDEPITSSMAALALVPPSSTDRKDAGADADAGAGADADTEEDEYDVDDDEEDKQSVAFPINTHTVIPIDHDLDPRSATDIRDEDEDDDDDVANSSPLQAEPSTRSVRSVQLEGISRPYVGGAVEVKKTFF